MLLFAVQFGALYIALAAGMPAATTALIACSSPLAVAALSAALVGAVTGINGLGCRDHDSRKEPAREFVEA
jgi:hypothetical protein